MKINFNGTNGKINFNGTGGVIHFGNPGKTVTPTIESAYWSGSGTGPFKNEVQVKNNGDGAGTAYARSGWSGEWVSAAVAAYGTVWIETDSTSFRPADGVTFTAHAYVTQTGKTPSDIVTKESGGFVPMA